MGICHLQAHQPRWVTVYMVIYGYIISAITRQPSRWQHSPQSMPVPTSSDCISRSWESAWLHLMTSHRNSVKMNLHASQWSLNSSVSGKNGNQMGMRSNDHFAIYALAIHIHNCCGFRIFVQPSLRNCCSQAWLRSIKNCCRLVGEVINPLEMAVW